jgi:GxxExxY protein
MTPLYDDPTDKKLTYKIIGAAMEVHNRIGPGYKEEVYENALCVELQKCGVAATSQYPLAVLDQGEQVAQFYLDLFVEDQVVVELKAFSHPLSNDDLAQMINYLKASQAPVGLLFNFGRRSLEYRRVFPGRNAAPVQRLGRDDIDIAGRG